MVADFAAVKDAFAGFDAATFDDAAGVGGEFGEVVADGFNGAGGDFEVVVGQVFGVGARVGEDFVFFVAFLRELQGAPGGEAEAVAGFALQGGEVEELRRRDGDGFFGFADASFAAAAALGDGAGGGFVPDAVAGFLRFFGVFAPGGVDPFAFVVAGLGLEGGVDFVVGFGDEGEDFFLTRGEQGEGGGLYAAGGGDVEAAGG